MTIIALYSIVLQVGISSDRIAGMAQSVERRIGSAEVTGPIPVASLARKKAVILDKSRVTAFLVAGIRKKLPVAGSGGAGILSETTEKHIEKLYPVRIPVCFSVVSEILLRRKKGDYLCTRVFLWNWQAEP